MNDALLQFGLTNLAASAAIMVVLLLRKPVRRRFGAGLAYAMWALPVLAAMASLLPPRIVVEHLPLAGMTDMAAPLAAGAPMDGATFTFPDGSTFTVSYRPEAPAPQAPAPIDFGAIAGWLWLAGAAGMLAVLARRQARFMADVREGLAGPAVVGLFTPRIVTPSDFETRFDARERSVVLAHERVHLTRNDARINAAVALARCVCWFNPLVHVAAHAMRIDQELACDAAVVARHPTSRKAYADALLKAQLAARPLPLGCYWPPGAEHPLMERIAMLKEAAPGRARRFTGVGLLGLLAFSAGFAAWAAMPPETRVEFEAPQQDQAVAPPARPGPPVERNQPEAPQAAPAPASPTLKPLFGRMGISRPAAAPNPPPPPAVTEAQRAAAGGLLEDSIARLFDSDAPVFVEGRVVETGDFTIDGERRMSFVIEASRVVGPGSAAAPAGARWRWIGGPTPRTFNGGMSNLNGRDVTVRGYRSKDRACLPACLVNGAITAAPEQAQPALVVDPPFVRVAPSPPPGPQSTQPAPVKDSFVTVPLSAQRIVMDLPSEYDPAQPVTIFGGVEHLDITWGRFKLSVRDERGQVWEFQRSADGAQRKAVQQLIGKRVLVQGYRAKDTRCSPTCKAYAREISTVERAPIEPPRPAPASMEAQERPKSLTARRMVESTGRRLPQADEAKPSPDVGAQPQPMQQSFQPLVRDFDPDKPIWFDATIEGFFNINGRRTVMLRDETGALWTGDLGRTPVDVASHGDRITVRGYAAKGETCKPDCRLAVKDITKR